MNFALHIELDVIDSQRCQRSLAVLEYCPVYKNCHVEDRIFRHDLACD